VFVSLSVLQLISFASSIPPSLFLFVFLSSSPLWPLGSPATPLTAGLRRIDAVPENTGCQTESCFFFSLFPGYRGAMRALNIRRREPRDGPKGWRFTFSICVCAQPCVRTKVWGHTDNLVFSMKTHTFIYQINCKMILKCTLPLKNVGSLGKK